MKQAPSKPARRIACGPTSTPSAADAGSAKRATAIRGVADFDKSARYGASTPSGKGARQQRVRTLRVAGWAVLVTLLSLPSVTVWAQAKGPILAAGDSDPDMRDGLGSGTRALLALQVSGTAAGPQQPMTGDATSAAYKRYTDSFTHSVPEFFQQRVKSDSSGGS